MKWEEAVPGYWWDDNYTFCIIRTSKRSFLLQQWVITRGRCWCAVAGYNTLEEAKFAAELIGDTNAMET